MGKADLLFFFRPLCYNEKKREKKGRDAPC